MKKNRKEREMWKSVRRYETNKRQQALKKHPYKSLIYKGKEAVASAQREG